VFTYLYHSNICDFAPVEENGSIIAIDHTPDKLKKDAVIKETRLIREASRQIFEYFDQNRVKFDLPIDFCGTEFQEKVWRELMNIPYGQTRSYGDIAKNIGSPKAARAVGMANNKNPLPIIIPCHRVIGANGKLVGYAPGLDIKEKLLNIEKSFGKDTGNIIQ